MHAKWTFIFLTLILLISCGPSDRYSNGQLKQRIGTMKDKNGNTLNHGEFVEWFENGQKSQQGTYFQGRLEGPFYQWYENGKKRSLRFYENGDLNGTTTWWDEDGHKTAEKFYKDGIEQ